jgi:hypothetical protein
MNISKLARSPRAMKAMTGISYEEFASLAPIFERAERAYRENKPDRMRKAGGGRKGHLRTAEDKLFYILFYVKTYPTFDIMSFFFGKGRGRSCEITHLYLELLEKTLGEKIVLPVRRIGSIEEFICLFPEVRDVFPDGTERRIQRPKKAKQNSRYYSGKKKAHTRKNIIMTDDNKRILLVSPTKPGRRHDKRLSDRISLIEHIPKGVGIWTDSGFQGIEKHHSNAYVAKRGRKNRPLTDEEKQENRIISSLRVGVEHAIGGMKRFRAYHDVLRNKIGRFDDRIAVVAAGLWNYRLQQG